MRCWNFLSIELKRLWRGMLKWKGISQEREDTKKRKAVDFEEFHVVLEFLKYLDSM